MFRDGRVVSDERQAPTSAVEALRALDKGAGGGRMRTPA